MFDSFSDTCMLICHECILHLQGTETSPFCLFNFIGFFEMIGGSSEKMTSMREGHVKKLVD